MEALDTLNCVHSRVVTEADDNDYYVTCVDCGEDL